MSNFKEYEQNASVYNPSDSSSKKTTMYPVVPSLTIKIFPIKRSEEDRLLMGQELGNYVANVRDGAAVRQGAIIILEDGQKFKVNDIRRNILFNRWRLSLAEITGQINFESSGYLLTEDGNYILQENGFRLIV